MEDALARLEKTDIEIVASIIVATVTALKENEKKAG
jgi:hypothetical protein